MASWHKDVEALLISVQTAWAAAERMRLAVEKHDHDPEQARQTNTVKG
jgi:hypothetical protein